VWCPRNARGSGLGSSARPVLPARVGARAAGAVASSTAASCAGNSLFAGGHGISSVGVHLPSERPPAGVPAAGAASQRPAAACTLSSAGVAPSSLLARALQPRHLSVANVGSAPALVTTATGSLLSPAACTAPMVLLSPAGGDVTASSASTKAPGLQYLGTPQAIPLTAFSATAITPVALMSPPPAVGLGMSIVAGGPMPAMSPPAAAMPCAGSGGSVPMSPSMAASALDQASVGSNPVPLVLGPAASLATPRVGGMQQFASPTVIGSALQRAASSAGPTSSRPPIPRLAFAREAAPHASAAPSPALDRSPVPAGVPFAGRHGPSDVFQPLTAADGPQLGRQPIPHLQSPTGVSPSYMASKTLSTAQVDDGFGQRRVAAGAASSLMQVSERMARPSPGLAPGTCTAEYVPTPRAVTLADSLPRPLASPDVRAFPTPTAASPVLDSGRQSLPAARRFSTSSVCSSPASERGGVDASAATAAWRGPTGSKSARHASQPTDAANNSTAAPVDDTMTLTNRLPEWNESMRSLSMRFLGGRVTDSSSKNFLLELQPPARADAGAPEACRFPCLQFGRMAGGRFSCDFRHPMSALQAFGIMLSSFYWLPRD